MRPILLVILLRLRILLLMAHRWEQHTLLGNNVECVVRVTRTFS